MYWYTETKSPPPGRKITSNKRQGRLIRRLAMYTLIQGSFMRYSPAMSLHRAFFYYSLRIILLLAGRNHVTLSTSTGAVRQGGDRKQ